MGRALSHSQAPVPPERKASPPRKRLTAEQARARILGAAEEKLAQVGPEGLRLTELATELGISHPAILHHFGSREELVGAVVGQATSRLNQRLMEIVQGREAGGRDAAFDTIAEFYAEQGHARLIAWLVLSGRSRRTPTKGVARPLEKLIALAHVQREQAQPGRRIELEDTRFRSQLSALALLGDAIFGDVVRYASGEPVGPEASRAFRRRLAKLLRETA